MVMRNGRIPYCAVQLEVFRGRQNPWATSLSRRPAAEPSRSRHPGEARHAAGVVPYRFRWKSGDWLHNGVLRRAPRLTLCSGRLEISPPPGHRGCPRARSARAASLDGVRQDQPAGQGRKCRRCRILQTAWVCDRGAHEHGETSSLFARSFALKCHGLIRRRLDSRGGFATLRRNRES